MLNFLTLHILCFNSFIHPLHIGLEFSRIFPNPRVAAVLKLLGNYKLLFKASRKSVHFQEALGKPPVAPMHLSDSF
jgi:hypothetical protein